MHIRELRRDEIDRVWTIDRRETIRTIYRLVDGELVAEHGVFDAPGWPPGESEKYTPLLYACYDRGGLFYGAFEGEHLLGAAVLDNRFLGRNRDLLQLEFLHVSADARGRGIGARLFAVAQDAARARGAAGLYISATPSEHTLAFYRRFGCTIADEPDPALLALEPEDIHLVCMF